MDLPVSPCIRNCCLDTTTDVCLGCFRSLDEITGWHDADRKERLAILARSAERRNAHETRHSAAWPLRDRRRD